MVVRIDSADVTSASHCRLYPLPLVPFEAMMWLDDQPGYPMICTAEFSFEGDVDRDKLMTALECARLRHPLFSANVCERRRRSPCWIPAEMGPQVQFHTLPELHNLPLPNIDLRQDVGLRLAVGQGRGESRLRFDFHHACSDGVGGLAFMEDFLLAYAACFAAGSEVAALPRREPSLLRRRGVFENAHGWSMRRILNECMDLGTTSVFFRQKPKSLAARSNQLPVLSPDILTPLVNHRLEGSILSALRAAAVSRQMSLNDLLVAALFLTLRDWNGRHGDLRPHDCFRVLLPISLRERAHVAMPAANRMSYFFLTRRVHDIPMMESLLPSLRSEMDLLRRDRYAERILSKLGILHAVPGALRYVMQTSRCFATAVLSNVGDPTRRFQARFCRENGRLVAGNLRMTGFAAATPLRPQTRAAFFVNTYADQLTITARLDPRYFSAEDAFQFLHGMEQHLVGSRANRQIARAA